MSQHQPELTDPDREAFIKALDESAVEIRSDWELQFIESCLKRFDRRQPLTPKMRNQIDRLMMKYRGRVRWGNVPLLKPVRSQTREAHKPDPLFK